MNIGIDLDGVVFNSEFYYRTYCELFDLKNKGEGQINPKEYYFQKRYNWTDEKIKEFSDTYQPLILNKAEIMVLAKEVLTELNKKHKIFFITARGQFPMEILVTKKRLKKEKIPFEKIIFNQKSKVVVCKENNIALMIDDNPIVIDELFNAGINCILFSSISNCSTKNDVKKVYNWGEVYRYLIENNII